MSPQNCPCLVMRSNHMMGARPPPPTPPPTAPHSCSAAMPPTHRRRFEVAAFVKQPMASSALVLDGGETCRDDNRAGKDARVRQGGRLRWGRVGGAVLTLATLILLTSSCWSGEERIAPPRWRERQVGSWFWYPDHRHVNASLSRIHERCGEDRRCATSSELIIHQHG